MPKIPPRTGEIKKGQVRNPKGSSAKARAMAKVKKLTGEDLAAITSLLLTANRDNLKEVGDDPNATFLQVWTAKLLADSFKKGDVAIYRAILDRVVGRPKETVAIGGDADGSPLRVDTRTREEKLERLAALRAARKVRDGGKDG